MRRSALAILLLASCRTPSSAEAVPPSQADAVPVEPADQPQRSRLDAPGEPAAPPEVAEQCGGEPLRVVFYDAGQALAALVTLPDGRHLLVDAGESPSRAGCGAACKAWHQRVLDGLKVDVSDGALELLWITHQHSDHLGGVPGVAKQFRILQYMDNGQDLDRKTVAAARRAASENGAAIVEVGPGTTTIPIETDADVTLTAMVPAEWPRDCTDEPNECSIGLLVDYCDSEILFTGDAEQHAEDAWEVADVDLLQVGHHGSKTSSTPDFLARVQPDYAVISCGKPREGTNRTYCHPLKPTLERLTAALGSPGMTTAVAFDDEVRCTAGKDSNWDETPVSDRLWVTARDGAVVLETTGDGHFTRVETRRYMSDAEIRNELVLGSQARYGGNCPCPEDTMSNGRRCGARSAYAREGGEDVLCYPKDVTPGMIEQFRSAQR